jgi:hypothetical protein
MKDDTEPRILWALMTWFHDRRGFTLQEKTIWPWELGLRYRVIHLENVPN